MARTGRHHGLVLAGLLADLGRLALPADCAGCGRPGRALCAVCRAALAPRVVERRVGALRVVSGLTYDGPAREVVLAFKNHGRTDLAGPLAAALRAAAAAALEGVPGDGLVLVPVPATGRSRHERGYDPVAVVQRRAGLPRHRMLRLVARPRDQVLLGREGRFANAAGTMRARPSSAGARVVLVDDVVTTGATLAEAARALREAGAEVVGAITVAAVPRRSSDPASRPRAIPARAD